MNYNSDNPLNGAKSRQEIAWAYGLHARTLVRKLKKLGIELPPGAVLPYDQKRIYEALGLPHIELKNSPPDAKMRDEQTENAFLY